MHHPEASGPAGGFLSKLQLSGCLTQREPLLVAGVGSICRGFSELLKGLSTQTYVAQVMTPASLHRHLIQASRKCSSNTRASCRYRRTLPDFFGEPGGPDAGGQ